MSSHADRHFTRFTEVFHVHKSTSSTTWASTQIDTFQITSRSFPHDFRHFYFLHACAQQLAIYTNFQSRTTWGFHGDFHPFATAAPRLGSLVARQPGTDQIRSVTQPPHTEGKNRRPRRDKRTSYQWRKQPYQARTQNHSNNEFNYVNSMTWTNPEIWLKNSDREGQTLKQC